jgi:hypothetical protein
MCFGGIEWDGEDVAMEEQEPTCWECASVTHRIVFYRIVRSVN